MNPYVPFQLNEIAALKSIKTWSNSRVRIFGKIGQSIHATSESELDLRYYHSVGEEILSTIIVDFSLILDTFNTKFNEGSVTQILGDLQNFEKDVEDVNYSFMVSAHIIRDFSSVDPELYHQASTIQSMACPKEFFMKSCKDINTQEDETFEDNSPAQLNKHFKKHSRNEDNPNEKGEPSKHPISENIKSNDSSVDMFDDLE